MRRQSQGTRKRKHNNNDAEENEPTETTKRRKVTTRASSKKSSKTQIDEDIIIVSDEEDAKDDDFNLPTEENGIEGSEDSSDDFESTTVPTLTRSSRNIDNVTSDIKTVSHKNLHVEFDFAGLQLRPDHAHRPIWACPNKFIYLEAFSPYYKEAYDFLIAIANPVSRTRFIHTYHLNRGSLYAAISSGLTPEHIIRYLDQLSKVELPKEITNFIVKVTEKLGKAKLVLKKNGYYIESSERAVLEQLLEDSVIKEAAKSDITFEVSEPEAAISFPGELDLEQLERELDRVTNQPDPNNQEKPNPAATSDEPEVAKRREYFTFEINPQKFEDVKRRCIDLDLPLLEEYDFSKDTVNPDINISLKLNTSLRKYQEKSLSKMFANGRARSGIISLPCGAGKSLVGVVAATTIKKRTLVLCTGAVSVHQWVHQFKLWTTIHHTDVVPFVSGSSKQRISSVKDLGAVLVTTYSMLVSSGKRSVLSNKIIDLIQSQEWGLIILDEVHVVPANTFRKVISTVKSHCKLGLTATLVREDDMIDHLLYLIGPKIYEANWLDLVRSGHIANVRCCEVWCPMTPEFYSEYLRTETRRQPMLYILNPNKIKACEFLVKFHEAREDKIIVFSDNIFALKYIAKLLDRPFIYGDTTNAERTRIFTQFQYNASVRTIFVSKIGDNSIDLPEANVIVQISSQYGSRRQEAQRLGRILRPKSKSQPGTSYDAFFYSLVSTDTKEMYYSTKRQQFLIEQGYAFKVIRGLHLRPGITQMQTTKQQLDLLTKILAANIEEIARTDDENVDIAAIDEVIAAYEREKARTASSAELVSVKSEPQEDIIEMPPDYRLLSYTRSTGALEALTGATGINYEEYDYD